MVEQFLHVFLSRAGCRGACEIQQEAQGIRVILELQGWHLECGGWQDACVAGDAAVARGEGARACGAPGEAQGLGPRHPASERPAGSFPC